MEYRITFLNENPEHTIVERGMNALENTRNNLETLLNAENHETEDLGSLYDYGFSFDPITDVEGNVQYFCYQLSTGIMIRFYPHRTEFVYLDWFSGVGFDVSGDEVFQQLRSFLDDMDLLDFKRRREK